jgi:hypothetical protein
MDLKEKSLCLFAFFLPLEQILFYVFGIQSELKPYRVFLILALILTFLDKSFLKYKLNKVFKSFFFIFAYGLLIGLFRIALGKGSLDYLTNNATHFFIGLLIFYLLSNITNKKLLSKVFNYFIIGLLVSSAYGFYSLIFMPDSHFRLRGFFNNPNHLAFAINFVSPVLIYKIKNEKNKFHLIIFLFLTTIVFLSGSRTGLFLQILLLLYLIIIFSRNIYNIIISVFLIIISYNFILKQILGLNLNLFDRFELSNVKEASGRLDIIDAAMALGFDTLFMGVGIGQYKFYHLDYISSSAYNTLTEFDLTTHNHMLDLLVNYGFISFFIFLFAFYKVFIFYFRNQHIYFFKFALFTVFILLISSLSQEMFTFPLYWMFLSLLTIPIYNNFFYD